MVSPWERERLSAIERWFEAEDPAFARALRDAVPPRVGRSRGTRSRVLACVVVDLLGAGLFVTSVVLSSFLLLLASAVMVATALVVHILLPSGN
jgi:hypothetical protein